MDFDDFFRFLSEISPGFLQFGDVRMALLDIEAGFWGIRRQVEVLIGSKLTTSIFQQAGAKGGASFAASFGISEDALTQGQLFASCVQAFQVAGFREFTIEEASRPIESVAVQARDAFEAWMTQRHGTQAEGRSVRIRWAAGWLCQRSQWSAGGGLR